MLFYRQIKGIIALAIFLAVIPFFRFIHRDAPEFQGPVFSVSENRTIVLEVVDKTQKSGIYFVAPLMTLKHLLQCLDSNVIIDHDFALENGTSIKLKQSGEQSEIMLGQISADKRIALGLPLNINLVSFDELMLVPGLGESTVQKIVDRRQEIGKFKRLEQLMEISGIKEKKFSKLSQYLYVEKAGN